MGSRANRQQFKNVAPGVQSYWGPDDSRKFRVRCMINGMRLQRTIPERVFTSTENAQEEPLTEEEAILIASQVYVRFRKLLRSGESSDTAWQKICGLQRRDISFREFVLERYLPSRVGEVSNSGHEYTAKALARYFGDHPIRSIGYDDIKAYVNKLKVRELSASRIRDYTGVLSMIFALAKRKDIVPENPARRSDEKEHKALWPTDPISVRAEKYAHANEVKLLIRAAYSIKLEGELVDFDPEKHHGNLARHDTRWLGDLIEFAFETGIRKGALLKIRWDQIYPPTDKMPNGHVHLRAKQVKTRKSRKVPLSRAAREVLDRRLECQERFTEDKKKDKRIFRGRLGQPNPSTRSAWEPVLKKAQELGLDTNEERLEDLRFHDLRASWAVDLLQRGAHVNQIQKVGGWSTLSAMMRYVRASDADLGSVQEALESRQKSSEVLH